MRTGSSLLGVTALGLMLVACTSGSGYGPGQPPDQGGHSGGGDDDGGADAGTIEADAATGDGVSGYACIVTDVRTPGDCQRAGLADFLVTLEDGDRHILDSTTTTDDGAFAFARPENVLDVYVTVADGAHLFHLSAQHGALVAGQETRVILPIIGQGYYGAILAASGQADVAGRSQVFLRLTHGATPIADATIGPLGDADAYYDAIGDSTTFTTLGPTTESGFAAWFDVDPTLAVGYDVTIGGVVTRHDAYAYPDATVFLSAVN